MKNEFIDTVNDVVNKDRKYNHTTKKELETKNRKKKVERKTSYQSSPTLQRFPVLETLTQLQDELFAIKIGLESVVADIAYFEEHPNYIRKIYDISEKSYKDISELKNALFKPYSD